MSSKRDSFKKGTFIIETKITKYQSFQNMILKLLFILVIVLPFPTTGQVVLDYQNDFLNQWAKTNKIKKLTTVYFEENFNSEKKIYSTLEELIYDEQSGKVRQFNSYLSEVDTVAYSKIKLIIQNTSPDTSYINAFGISTEIFSINKSKCIREYLTDEKGELVLELICLKGMQPVYIKYLNKTVSFDNAERIDKIQTNHIYGRNEWEYFFDTLSVCSYSYNLNTICVVTKTERIDTDNINIPTRNYSTDTNSIKPVDTLKLNDYELINHSLKQFFGLEDLSRLIKIVHRKIQPVIGENFKSAKFNLNESFEYVDPISGKRIFRGLPLAQHQILIQPEYGTQETYEYHWGKRVKNYYFDDSSLVLVEVLDFDKQERITTHYSRICDFDPVSKRYLFISRFSHEPLGWKKTSFEYIDEYSVIEIIYKDKVLKNNVQNPEKHMFNKKIKINRYDSWITDHIFPIDTTQFKLKVKKTEYLVHVEHL